MSTNQKEYGKGRSFSAIVRECDAHAAQRIVGHEHPEFLRGMEEGLRDRGLFTGWNRVIGGRLVAVTDTFSEAGDSRLGHQK